MATEKMWNVATRGAMFKMLRRIEINGKRVGMYHVSFKKGCDRFSKEELKQIIILLYEKMIARGFLDREKTSCHALATQLSICYGVATNYADIYINNHYKSGFNPGDTNQLRMIAYAAGWMRMIDIIELENLTVEAVSKIRTITDQDNGDELLEPFMVKIRNHWKVLENPPMAISRSYKNWIYFHIGKTTFHYEFLIQSKNVIGIEFHMEGSLKRKNDTVFQNLLPELEQILGKTITMKNPGKLVVATFPTTDDNVEPIVQEMISFMNKTKHIFEERFASLKK